MLFRIIVDNSNSGPVVRVCDGDGNPLNDPSTGLSLEPRTLVLYNAGGEQFPLPPVDEPVDTTAPEYDLCCGDRSVLTRIFGRIVGRAPQPNDGTKRGDIERFGRYLFHTLLGPTAWTTIERVAQGRSFELALSFRGFGEGEERWFTRLPWEMMYCPDKSRPGCGAFLAQLSPQVAITRRVPGVPPRNVRLLAPPRVLFVLGAKFSDMVIRPGAEYLGLLRALKANNLHMRLKTDILVQASRARLRAALKWFQPNIVHFICHGGQAVGSGPYLKFQNDDSSGEMVNVSANELLADLSEAPSVEIVVLNACYTASAEYRGIGQVASPMAMKLVQGDVNGKHVPLVIGMAGEVADRACRLFTRRFYESLLHDGMIAQAAAQGRRLGILNNLGMEPDIYVDWAMPTIFLPERASEAQIAVDPNPAEERWHQLGASLTPFDYPAFCGRLPYFQWYTLLMADRELQVLSRTPAGEPGGAFRGLALSVERKDLAAPGQERRQLGQSWLLHQIAAQAAYDGHLPLLLSSYTAPDQEWPGTRNALLERIHGAAVMTGKSLGIHQPQYWDKLKLLLRWREGDPRPALLDEPLFADYSHLNEPRDSQVYALALWNGLEQLLAAARAARPDLKPERMRVVLICDDVHLMGKEAVDFLLKTLLSTETLGELAGREYMRAVLAYAENGDSAMQHAIDALKEWTRLRWVNKCQLTAFQPVEDMIAYRQCLAGWREGNSKEGKPQPLILSPRLTPEAVAKFVELMNKKLSGVPSLLGSQRFTDMIDVMLSLGSEKLMPASDDELFQEQQMHAGGN